MDPGASIPELQEKYTKLHRDRYRLKGHVEKSTLEVLDKGLEAIARQIILTENDPEVLAYLRGIKDQEHDIAQGRYSNFRRILVEHLYFPALLKNPAKDPRLDVMRGRLTPGQWNLFNIFTRPLGSQIQPQASRMSMRGSLGEENEAHAHDRTVRRKASKRNDTPHQPSRTDNMF